ncbi:hypothetical protein [Paracoccus sp. PAR01]|uniref:hypothetical protein n=1 Tax=Paracoccus sp. PAR01 TaxID=2769282 RepID=UPI00177E66D3|nr:hypothetical protein [Paracoccus sp. PAR01]MBD9529478.1 hypothetical protein [Paracoccus sp. PAR01]
MSWLEWSSAVIGSTAWPISTIVIALIFRGQVSRLLKRVKGAKYGDAEVYFREELDKIEAQVSDLPIAPKPGSIDALPEASQLPESANPDSEQPPNDDSKVKRIADPLDQFNEIAKLSPSAAVLTAWRDVELELERSLRRSGLPKTKLPPSQIAKRLHEMGVIDTPTMDVIKELQNLRNMAAHAGEVSITNAYRFKTLARDVVHRLEYELAR